MGRVERMTQTQKTKKNNHTELWKCGQSLCCFCLELSRRTQESTALDTGALPACQAVCWMGIGVGDLPPNFELEVRHTSQFWGGSSPPPPPPEHTWHWGRSYPGDRSLSLGKRSGLAPHFRSLSLLPLHNTDPLRQKGSGPARSSCIAKIAIPNWSRNIVTNKLFHLWGCSQRKPKQLWPKNVKFPHQNFLFTNDIHRRRLHSLRDQN